MQRVHIDMDLDGHIEGMNLVLIIVAFLQTEGMDKSTLHIWIVIVTGASHFACCLPTSHDILCCSLELPTLDNEG